MVGKHPAVVRAGLAAGVIRQDTRLFADDPIVLANPTLFVDESTVPGPPGFGQPPAPPSTERQSNPEWNATVRAYRACRVRHPDELPTQEEVARERGLSEDTLTRRLRKLDIAGWHDVHALVEIEPA
jgi:hypothetical protein